MPRLFTASGLDIPTVANPAKLKVPTTSFSPADVSGLVAWYEADAITGLDNGATVVQWDDLSGNGHHLAHNDPNFRPTYQTGVINGLPVVRFDGSNDFVFNTSMTRAQPERVFVLAKYRTAYVSGSQYLVGGRTGTAGIIGRNSNDQVKLYSGSFACTVNTDTETFTIYSALFNGASSELRVNGGAASTGNAGTTVPTGGVNISSRDGGSEPADADIYAVLFYSEALSSADRAAVEAYLAGKAGITLA